MMKKIFGKTFGGLRIYSYLCSRIKRQGHSPVGLERCSHIAEVPGSSPGVPTERISAERWGFPLYKEKHKKNVISFGFSLDLYPSEAQDSSEINNYLSEVHVGSLSSYGSEPEESA